MNALPIPAPGGVTPEPCPGCQLLLPLQFSDLDAVSQPKQGTVPADLWHCLAASPCPEEEPCSELASHPAVLQHFCCHTHLSRASHSIHSASFQPRPG